LSNYEGEIAESELPMNVYRVDGKTGAVTIVADGINAPNGLCFAPDEKKLYIVESRSEPRRILVYDVVGAGSKIANGKILIDSGPHGTPDGMRCGIDGNLWCGWSMTAELDGVRRRVDEHPAKMRALTPRDFSDVAVRGHFWWFDSFSVWKCFR
jgi:gluconolactonase